MPTAIESLPKLNVGMVGLGMIFEETYRPLFEQLDQQPLYERRFGIVEVELTGVATRTGKRAEALQERWSDTMPSFRSFAGDNAVVQLAALRPHIVCIATPDDRHFEPALQALRAGCHVLIEKPSVLFRKQWQELQDLANSNDCLIDVVYHKLYDPDHKKLRTLYHDGVMKHVNSGYCSLLEPKSIATGQFAQWIEGRNPATYVAVHYLKLIDFSFAQNWRPVRVTATGQRGIVRPANSNTWDSVQLQVVYQYPNGREAAFDIHTSWVNPENFPGYVEQEVQFRFDNATWNAHQRKRGVEVTIEDQSPDPFKYTPNHHYNGTFLEPGGERSQCGYGLEAIEAFFRRVAYVEFGFGGSRADRLLQIRQTSPTSLAADGNVVKIIEAFEAVLAAHAAGKPGCVVFLDGDHLRLAEPGGAERFL